MVGYIKASSRFPTTARGKGARLGGRQGKSEQKNIYNKNYWTECIIMFMSKMNNSMKGQAGRQAGKQSAIQLSAQQSASPRIRTSWPGQDAVSVPRHRAVLFEEVAARVMKGYAQTHTAGAGMGSI